MGTVGYTEEFGLRLWALGTREVVLAWILHLFFNRCQERIKHARILLGEMTNMRENEKGAGKGQESPWLLIQVWTQIKVIEGCVEVCSLPYSFRKLWWSHLQAFKSTFVVKIDLFLTKMGLPYYTALFSHWLGVAYRTCTLEQTWQWISEYSSWHTLSVTVLIAGDFCGAFLRPPQRSFQNKDIPLKYNGFGSRPHNKANISSWVTWIFLFPSTYKSYYTIL